jgi:two-component system chemotaxis response regulator CheY
MLRILVVEDSSSTRALVRAILEDPEFEKVAGRNGVDVREAESGFDAMRFLPRGQFDLVITDINMPDINGLELIQFIRKSPHMKDTPILVISTQAAERDIARGLSLGANAFVAKPFTRDALRDACVSLLRTPVTPSAKLRAAQKVGP